LVAAASITSQMSMSIRSARTASSLTSAMLTERKMFSSSLESSATSGVDTGTMRSQMRA
jgi:capsule polysaccharide export protein KpsE/RkpR